jgi:hypothetical protein
MPWRGVKRLYSPNTTFQMISAAASLLPGIMWVYVSGMKIPICRSQSGHRMRSAPGVVGSLPVDVRSQTLLGLRGGRLFDFGF